MCPGKPTRERSDEAGANDSSHEEGDRLSGPGDSLPRTLRAFKRNRIVYLFPQVTAVLAAVTNCGDLVTTLVGLHEGLHEANPISVAIMSAVGLAGWAAVKGAFSLAALGYYLLVRTQWQRMSPLTAVLFSLAMGTILGGIAFVFGLAVLSNLRFVLEALSRPGLWPGV